MNNKETLNAYNERLVANNTSLESILETINNLPEAGSGGGGSSQLATYAVDNVNFLDYKGNTLYSYTLDEIQELTELPPLPTGDMFPGLKWNWTLEELKESGIAADVGALYDVDDDVAFFLTVYVNELMVGQESKILFKKTLTTEELNYTIDWGDSSSPSTGSQESGSSITIIKETHVYDNVGTYQIKVRLQNAINQQIAAHTNTSGTIGTYIFTPVEALSSGVVDRKASIWWYNIKEVVLGPRCNSSVNMFYKTGIEYVMVGDIEFNMAKQMFCYCKALRHFTFPKNVIGAVTTDLGGLMFDNCSVIKTISLPYSFPKNLIGSQFCRQCFTLEKLVLPEGSTGTSSVLSEAYNVKYVWLPNTVTAIAYNALNGPRFNPNIRFGPNIKSIAELALHCYTGVFDFSRNTIVPTLHSNSFGANVSLIKIIVPDELYDTWVAASNWSTYASYIVKASEV